MKRRFRNILDYPLGVRYIYSLMELCSPLSNSILLDTPYPNSAELIKESYRELAQFASLLQGTPFLDIKSKIIVQLSNLKDIRNSLKRISEGSIADDIELFEVKSFVMINQRMRELIVDLDIDAIKLEDLSDIYKLLDPDNNNISSFYIYDSYDPQLKELRENLKSTDEYNEEILYKCHVLESKIREQLSASIKPRLDSIVSSLLNLAKMDILMAKAELMLDNNFVIPTFSKDKIFYKGLFNPEVNSLLAKEKKEYQKIDIELYSKKPLLITGSNMGGKSLTLKTLALCQYLFHFGFAIPAQECTITPVEEILISAGDDEDYRKGLSSFAAEIKRIDSIIKTIKKGKVCLTLIDEPARTTNPLEGAALATALLKVISQAKGVSVITTHYTIGEEGGSRLRVKGFVDGKMDYSLIPDIKGESPHEALNIAETLNADPEWLELAKAEINKNKIKI